MLSEYESMEYIEVIHRGESKAVRTKLQIMSISMIDFEPHQIKNVSYYTVKCGSKKYNVCEYDLRCIMEAILAYSLIETQKERLSRWEKIKKFFENNDTMTSLDAQVMFRASSTTTYRKLSGWTNNGMLQREWIDGRYLYRPGLKYR